MATSSQANLSHDVNRPVPTPTDPSHLSRGYGVGSHPEQSRLPASDMGAVDFAPAQGAPVATSPLTMSEHPTQSVPRREEFGTSRRNSSVMEGNAGGDLYRTNSTMSQSQTLTPSRGGTLKKKASLSKKASLRRSGSRKGNGPGNASLLHGEKERFRGVDGDEINTAFFVPVPTTGNPTEILANRFQAWRKVLKDLIAYFRDIQKSYESRSKSLLSVSNLISSTITPPAFLTEDGIGDAIHILRDYHKQALAEGIKARDIENDVIVQLSGLRSDLSQKCKEIKGLAGDFKNSVDKETEGTRKAVRDLQEALGLVDTEPNATVGRGDPFIVRLRVERQVERQIDEENYLHRAFLNLENSGRELESIVIGEIQKAYNAYAGILKREADEAYEAVERLRSGPIAMPKDREWDAFVYENEHFVDPRIPVRRAENISYPGKDDPAAAEVRAGMLERKSKYLKSYTPGWYVLSPTHLHEFKSADHLSSQQPIMSLYLPEQKLGSRSSADSSSYKFMLKGRQTGAMHRGHAWIFRAESYDTMTAWCEDIKNLTEKTGEERNAFVRRHARSVSGGSHKPGSVSSDGVMDEDEADQVPFSANTSRVHQTAPKQDTPERPQPGGRFPSDLQVNRFLQAPLSPSSATSSGDRDAMITADSQPESSAPRGQSDLDERNAQGRIHNEVSPDAPVAIHDADKRQQDETVKRDLGQNHQPIHPQSYTPDAHRQHKNVKRDSGHDDQPVHTQCHRLDAQQHDVARRGLELSGPPVQSRGHSLEGLGVHSEDRQPMRDQRSESAVRTLPTEFIRRDSNYANWMASGKVGSGGTNAGTYGTEADRHHQQHNKPESHQQTSNTSNTPYTGEVAHSSTLVPTFIGELADTERSQNTHAVPTLQASQAENTSTVPNTMGNSALNTSTASYLQARAIPLNDSKTPGPNSPVAQQHQARVGADASEGAITVRPTMQSYNSIQTVSDLHVPGEFPPTPNL